MGIVGIPPVTVQARERGSRVSTTQLQISSWQQVADHFPGVQPIANLEKTGELDFRSYQALATMSVLFSGFRGVVRAATGSGKTVIASAICGAFLPRTSVVMIHGRALVEQTYNEFVRFLGKENVGYITTEGFHPGKVTIASIDTIAFYTNKLPEKRGVPVMDPKKYNEKKKVFLKYLAQDVDMLVFDECHHSSADMFQDIGKYTRAFYRVGLSGTPLKKDELSDMLLLSLVGPITFDLNARWLQDKDYLAKAKLEIRELDYTSPTARKYSYNDARTNLLIKNQDRIVHIANDIAKVLEEPNTRLLVLTGNSVDLAESLAEELNALTRPLQRKLGYCPFALATGKMNSKKVVRAFNQLRRGDIQCVITTKIADEGIDVPDVNTLFLVGGGKAYVAAVQRIGRGLRKKKGDQELLVVDYFTLGNKYVEKHDRQRLKTYEEEDFFYEIVRV